MLGRGGTEETANRAANRHVRDDDVVMDIPGAFERRASYHTALGAYNNNR